MEKDVPASAGLKDIHMHGATLNLLGDIAHQNRS
jgi:hypothetical protein